MRANTLADIHPVESSVLQSPLLKSLNKIYTRKICFFNTALVVSGRITAGPRVMLVDVKWASPSVIFHLFRSISTRLPQICMYYVL